MLQTIIQNKQKYVKGWCVTHCFVFVIQPRTSLYNWVINLPNALYSLAPHNGHNLTAATFHQMGIIFMASVLTTFAHYGDVIMGATAPQITSVTIVYSTFIQAQFKENIKALRHWPLWGEFTGARWLVNSPHKEPATPNIFPFDGVIMKLQNIF